MAHIDPFSAEIVKLVRSMPDEAILALVKNQLGSGTGAAIANRAARAVAAGGRVANGRGRAGRGRAPASAPIAVAPVAPSKPGPKPGRKPGRKPALAAVTGPSASAPKGRPAVASPRAVSKPGPKPKAAAKGARRGGRSGAGRQELLASVERVVKSGGGLSASEIAKSAGVPQSRVTSALKELKLAKRIYQGGDRRFARYAGDARSAEQASVSARQNASGPLVKKSGRKK